MGFMNGWNSGFTSYGDDLARIYHLFLASGIWDLVYGLDPVWEHTEAYQTWMLRLSGWHWEHFTLASST
jgi:hypothetical protein